MDILPRGRTAPGAVLVCAWLVIASAHAADAKSAAASVSAGQMLYREGILGTGGALRAQRDNGTRVEGAAAACINCHRRSGLGNVEGNITVPPITAKYLFRSADANSGDLKMAHVEGYHQDHPAFDEASLARAIREGVAPGGRKLSALMPRYQLDDVSMVQLTAYLKQLAYDRVPGVGETNLQFATIVTPDADPTEHKAMLDVLEHFFARQREVIAAEVRPMRAAREVQYRVTRRWDLHVWELVGPPGSWEQQLHDRMKAEPVFAVISGLGRRTWAPIHHFCEREQVPCLFPNIDLPVVDEKDFYPVYFSRGVLLEADLMASAVRGPLHGARRVIQLFRRGDIGEDAASALQAALHSDGIEVVECALPPVQAEGDLAAQLQDVRGGDTVVLWLRPDDVRALPPAAPAGSTVLMSGLMGGMEATPVPSGWRSGVRLVYPIDLPERRLARMNFPYGWFRVQHLPVIAERVQVNTYLACVIVSEAVGHLFDSFVPEFLVERLETMVSRRLANAYFPRLSLAPGQRFASKGGYLVRFTRPAAEAIAADGEWIVP